jgi:uncharacterized membrane protein YhdT
MLARLAMIVFTVGVIAIAVVVILYASGVRNLPLWLELTVLLAPIGLGVGLVSVVLNARRDPP